MKVVNEVVDDSSSGRGERMSECYVASSLCQYREGRREGGGEEEGRTDSSSENVRLVIREPKFLADREELSGEGLVDVEPAHQPSVSSLSEIPRSLRMSLTSMEEWGGQ